LIGLLSIERLSIYGFSHSSNLSSVVQFKHNQLRKRKENQKPKHRKIFLVILLLNLIKAEEIELIMLH